MHRLGTGADVVPDLRPDLAGRPAQRPGVLGAEGHLGVGVVVEEGEVRPPAQPHGVAGVEHDADDRLEALRPLGRRPDRSFRPVEARVRSPISPPPARKESGSELTAWTLLGLMPMLLIQMFDQGKWPRLWTRPDPNIRTLLNGFHGAFSHAYSRPGHLCWPFGMPRICRFHPPREVVLETWLLGSCGIIRQKRRLLKLSLRARLAIRLDCRTDGRSRPDRTFVSRLWPGTNPRSERPGLDGEKKLRTKPIKKLRPRIAMLRTYIRWLRFLGRRANPICVDLPGVIRRD